MIFSIGWVLLTLATVMPIYSSLVKDAFLVGLFLLLNMMLFSLGTLFFGWGISKYFLSVSVKIMESLIFITLVIPIFLLLTIGLSAARVFLALFIYMLLIGAFIIPPIKKKNFKKFIGKSIGWYYFLIFLILMYFPISLFIYLRGYSYGLYNSNDIVLILLNYILTISVTILWVIFLVQLEYNISSREKFDLKDKYSHNLGNIMQAIFTTFDLIKTKREPKRELVELEEILENKLKDASDLIKEIRKL